MKINFYYFILNILIIIILNIYVKEKQLSLKQHVIILSTYIFITIISYAYINSIIVNIFNLKYINVKSYIGLLIILNIIIIYILNKPIKLRYKIPSILLFIILVFISVTTLSIVVGNIYKAFYIMDIKNAINLINISFILFLLYLICISIIYISNHTTIKEIKEYINFIKKIITKKIHKVTLEELINKKDNLLIDGVNASIIFEDSNKDNIIKNYKKLNRNINAKLTNGYTLEENKMLKNICMKLRVSNLRTVDIYNENILNKISIDEYHLLKKVIES